MKKAICIVLCVLVAGMVIGGCKKKEPEATVTPAPTEAPTAVPTPTLAIVDSSVESAPIEAGATVVPGYSCLSGKPYTGDYKPLVVMIENSPAARPQTGLQTANVVYECLAEGSITRFMAVFNDELLDKAGPVRSARLYFISLAHEWGDAIYAHFGGNHNKNCAANVYDYINKYPFKMRIDGLSNTYGTITRSSDRKAPHNAYIDLNKARALYDYQPSYKPFAFTVEENYTGSVPAKEISMKFTSRSNNTQYIYNEENKVYMRSSDGKEHKDTVTDKQIEVKNVIVEMADYKLIYKDTHDAAVIGSGEAMLFTNGQMIKMKWSRADMNSRTIFIDPATNKEVPLQPGNTWIHVVPTSGSVEYK